MSQGATAQLQRLRWVLVLLGAAVMILLGGSLLRPGEARAASIAASVTRVSGEGAARRAGARAPGAVSNAEGARCTKSKLGLRIGHGKGAVLRDGDDDDDEDLGSVTFPVQRNTDELSAPSFVVPVPAGQLCAVIEHVAAASSLIPRACPRLHEARGPPPSSRG